MTGFRSNSLAKWSVFFLLLATVVVFGAYGWLRSREVRGEPLPVLRDVGSFSLTNQWGETFDSGVLSGQVWLADLIFTRCPGPCLRLTRNMADLQGSFGVGERVRLVSFTADPEFDTPEVLRAYGERSGAKRGRWDFLTGVRSYINSLVMDELLLAVASKPPEERETEDDLFLHSTKWVLVDREGRLRAVYEGTEKESVGRALRDIRSLLRERSN